MDSNSLEITRVVNAPIERVWQAWTDPKELTQWYAPKNMSTPVAEVDLRVGGEYRITMSGETGEHTTVGTFSVVEKPTKLVFSWGWGEGSETPTTVTVELTDIGEGKTSVTLRHEGFADTKARDGHKQGWEGVFDKLEGHIR